MKRIVLGLALLLTFTGLTQAQDCNPSGCNSAAVPVVGSAPYGADGSVIPMVTPVALPSYATVNLVGANEWSWAPGHTTWYNATSFKILIDLLDGKQHQVTLFLQDYDNYGRNEQVVVTTPTGTQLTQNAITNFSRGQYLSWNATGFIVITVTNNGGINAIANALYFDPPATSPTPPMSPLLPAIKYSVTINITPVAGATSYKVYRGTMSGGPYATLIGTTSTLVQGVYSVTDSTLVPGMMYYYVTTSVNGGGESGYSPEIPVEAP